MVMTSALLALTIAQESESKTESSSESESESESESSSGGSSGEMGSNYYYTALQGTSYYYAFAMNQCSAASIGASAYYYPTCVDASNMMLSIYADSDCALDPIAQQTFNSTQAVFKCDGVDTYAEIMLGFGGVCSSTLWSALQVCIVFSSTAYATVDCSNDGYGNLNIHGDSSCITTFPVALESTCLPTLAVDAGNNVTIDVYGSIGMCSVSTMTSTAVIDTTSSDTSSTSSTSSGSTTVNPTGTSSSTTEASSANSIGFASIVGMFVMVAWLLSM